MEIFDEAVKCYEKALEIDPENEGYKKNLGLAKEKLTATTAVCNEHNDARHKIMIINSYDLQNDYIPTGKFYPLWPL